MLNKPADHKTSLSIRFKLLLPIALGLICLILILLFVLKPIHLNKQKQQFYFSQNKILKTLNPSLIQNLLSRDFAALYAILENSLQIQSEWKYLELINNEGTRLYPIRSDRPALSATLLKVEHNLREEDVEYGKLILYTDWKNERDKKIDEIQELTYWSILIFSFIAIISFIWLTHWIHKPIKKLQETTFLLANGNYDSELTVTSNDEVGLLAESIDTMRRNIKASQELITNAISSLAAQEAKQRAILEAAPDAIITLNETGMIESFNSGAEKIFQYAAEEIIGKSIKLLMEEKFAAQHDYYLKNFTDAGNSIVMGQGRELTGKRRNGEIFPIEVNITAIRLDGKILFTGILRDITERKRIDKMKDEFIGTISHELRTPLTAIKGSMVLMAHMLENQVSQQIKDMIDIANRNVERLLLLINDILDFSKLESGEVQFNFETLDLTEFLNDAININQAYAEKYHTHYALTETLPNVLVNTDKARLMQALSNLMSNAAKFSPPEKAVELSLSKQDHMIRISVQDFGEGVPLDFQDKIFDKFTQAKSGNTREVGGTGLGLNIAKMIVENLGGKLGFTSVPGQGATFFIDLPPSVNS